MPAPTRPQRRAKSADRAQAELAALISRAVQEEAERAGGDEDAALAALIKRAIPDVMHLFDETWATARYDYTAYPALPDILRKPSKKDPDQIWEARPRFHHPGYSLPGNVQVTALDVNAAYLSALKLWLPIGKLEHTTGGEGVGLKRSGVHLITPALWIHDHLPDPLGDRDEPGALWVTDATLRLLLRLSGPKYGLTEAPEVHESWTSGATENFLDALGKLLGAAREEAIAAGDTLTLGVHQGHVLQVHQHHGGVDPQPGDGPPGLDAQHPLPGVREPVGQGLQGPPSRPEGDRDDGHRRTARHRRLAPGVPGGPGSIPDEDQARRRQSIR
ncbi:hypothetical protein ACIRD0_34215 [Streptomyces microflavus]|uniref:hypothetical protein n=1 Tax=Streptomyces microflavus TaxID=1919 RepID=UPI0038149381